MRRAVATLFALVLTTTALVSTAGKSSALDNGLALTPPMGWNDWNAFGCNVTEQLVKNTADKIASSGLGQAGYQYVNIDDCWLTHSRDAAGNLVPDPVKFPDGIKGTADYVHSLGLKLGIYEDAGTMTCAGYPGSLGHEQQDAATFASWGVDYLKYDNCNNEGLPLQPRYEAMRDALKATGRPIVFSLCVWGQGDVWTWGAKTGNLWRTTADIRDTYKSMFDNYQQNVGLASFAGPGGWNDPDMLEVGNGGMTTDEYKTHFSLWAEMAAPLLIGTDLTKASPTTLSILGNSDVIAVDQDKLGKQGVRISSHGRLDVLAKPLANGDVAVVLFNSKQVSDQVSTTASAVGLPSAPAYQLNDLWTHNRTETTGNIIASVPPHGVVMYRVSPLPQPSNTSPTTA
jgi:alpha-galactosidase